MARINRQANKKGVKTVRGHEGMAARVEDIVGRTGMRGEATQIRCKVLEGRDSGKIIRRNVKGPVKIGNILILKETEIEAQRLSKRKR